MKPILGRQTTRHSIRGSEWASVKRERRLRVLVLDEEIPYPPNAGKRIRTWNLLKRLARRHSICLLCYGVPEDPSADAIREAGIQLRLVDPQARLTGWGLYLQLFLNLFSAYPYSVTKHYSSRFQRELQVLLQEESWDLVQCEWTPYARYILPENRVPVLVATHNVESLIWARRAEHTSNPIGKLFFRAQEWKMRRFERRVLRRASAVTAVTIHDAETIRGWGVDAVALIPNGVDIEVYIPDPEVERENEVLALASLDWYPNLDALAYFTKEIFPLLRARNPEARLQIVGRKPSEGLRKQFSGISGINFVGEVEDVREYLNRAAVVVVPLRIGGGSRIKILEALAAGKAVVCTSIGAEGLDVVSGEHLLVADSPREFDLKIAELLASKEVRRELGKRGRERVIERYGWDDIAGRLESVWHSLSNDEMTAESISPPQSKIQVTQ